MARKTGLPKGTLDNLIEETEGTDPAAATAAMNGNGNGHDPLPLKTRARKARKAVPPYTSRASKKAPRASQVLAARPVVEWETDPVSRYRASRGLPLAAGPIPALRLAMQFAMDVKEVARKERSSFFGVVSKALAGYLNAYDRL